MRCTCEQVSQAFRGELSSHAGHAHVPGHHIILVLNVWAFTFHVAGIERTLSAGAEFQLCLWSPLQINDPLQDIHDQYIHD